MYNVGSTFTFDASTGSWYLRGGTVQGGTIKAESGVALIATTSAGYLNGVTLDGTGGNASPFDLTSTYGVYAFVTGGLTLNNATINIGSVGGSSFYGYLYFYYAGSQTLGGTGTVNFGDSGSNAIYFYSHYTFDKLTIAPGVTVQGANGTITGNAGFDFKGTITSDPTSVGSALTNTTINITPTSWLNEGTIQAKNSGRILAQGTNTNFSAGTLTGGSWKVFNNSILRLVNTGITTNAANIVLDGVNANFYRDTGTTNALTNLATNTAAGSCAILNGWNFTTAGAFSNAGDVTLGAGSTFTLPGGSNYTQTGGTTTVDGNLTSTGLVDVQGGTLQGGGTIAANVTNAGQIAPGTLAGLFTIVGDYTQTSGGSLNAGIGGATPGTGFDQLSITGQASIDGTLNVTMLNGFIPAGPDTFRIVNAGSRAGSFTTFNGSSSTSVLFTLVHDATGAFLDSNVAPTAGSDSDTTLEDQAVTTNAIANDIDPDGDTFAFVAVGTSTQGVTPVDNGDGTITYTPPADYFGIDSYTYTVRDVNNLERTGTVTITITHVNDVPSFTKGLN